MEAGGALVRCPRRFLDRHLDRWQPVVGQELTQTLPSGRNVRALPRRDAQFVECSLCFGLGLEAPPLGLAAPAIGRRREVDDEPPGVVGGVFAWAGVSCHQLSLSRADRYSSSSRWLARALSWVCHRWRSPRAWPTIWVLRVLTMSATRCCASLSGFWPSWSRKAWNRSPIVAR